MADDLVLEQLRNLRQDIKSLPTKDELATAVGGVELNVRTELQALRSELVGSHDRLAARVSQLERDVQELKRGAG